MNETRINGFASNADRQQYCIRSDTAFSIVPHLVTGTGSSSGAGDSIGLGRGSLENVRSLT